MMIRTSGSQKESRILDYNTRPQQTLHYDIEYDTTEPEDKLRGFVKDIQEMLSRYEGNRARIFEIEAELNDLEHYMEIGKYKNVPEGYRLYRKLAELRRERRACKNENDLLQPVYEHFHGTEVLKKLTMVQGECAKAKEAIGGRVYGVRTDVLNEWMKPDVDISFETYAERKLKIDEAEKKISNEIEKKKYELAWKCDESAI